MAAPTETPRIQIFGHSFVCHLKRHIRGTDGAFHLNINGPPLIQYTGFPGATVSVLRDNLDVVADFNPHIVILVIGTNDIYDVVNSPNTVAQQIVDLVDTLLFITGVHKVIVLQTLHRQRSVRYTRYPVDPDWYNPRVDELNKSLSEKLNNARHRRSHLWRLKGFWMPSRDMFADDGCHLTHAGNKKLASNIKAAVVAALRQSICHGD